MPKLVIATRRSALALWQAEHVADALRRSGAEVELLPLVTQGDRILDVPLAAVGGKGLFVKEIEAALLDGRADLAVHSLKDLPTALPPGLVLGAILEREDARDALCAPGVESFDALPRGARVGTSSLRRQSQLRALRPDLEIVNVRGNVQTRLAHAGAELAGVVLALAGLRRLSLEERISEVLPVDRCLPAIGQGALAVEVRADDEEVLALVRGLDHPVTRAATTAERALLARLEGGCQVPIAGHASIEAGRLVLQGLVGSVDGATILRVRREGSPADGEAIGRDAAEALLAQGAGALLAELQHVTVGPPH